MPGDAAVREPFADASGLREKAVQKGAPADGVRFDGLLTVASLQPGHRAALCAKGHSTPKIP